MRSNIGEFLSVLRKSKGMTQQEVADSLGVSNKTVSGWAEDTALFHDITLTFDRPPYEIAEAKRRMTSVAVQIGVTAGAWLLVVAVYTAIYIPRRKKFLRNLEKKGSR